MQRVPAQIALPGIDRLAGHEAAEGLEEVRRANIQRIEMANANLLEIRVSQLNDGASLSKSATV